MTQDPGADTALVVAVDTTAGTTAVFDARGLSARLVQAGRAICEVQVAHVGAALNVIVAGAAEVDHDLLGNPAHPGQRHGRPRAGRLRAGAAHPLSHLPTPVGPITSGGCRKAAT